MLEQRQSPEWRAKIGAANLKRAAEKRAILAF
jgi:hypothetical protein